MFESPRYIQNSFSIEVPIIHESVRSNSALSRCPHLSFEKQSWEEARVVKIRVLRGKYKNALTPSEEFASKNKLNLEMEWPDYGLCRKSFTGGQFFAIALAQRMDGTVLTSDHHEFDRIADESVCNVKFIRWYHPRHMTPIHDIASLPCATTFVRLHAQSSPTETLYFSYTFCPNIPMVFRRSCRT